MPALSERRRRFVDAYMGEAPGNATKAAELAGYSPKTAYAQGSRLLKNAEIRQAIDARQETDPKVATRAERQEFWTWVMHDPAVPWKDRLRASELLGRSCADFLDRLKVEHSLEDLIAQSWQRPAEAQSTETTH